MFNYIFEGFIMLVICFIVVITIVFSLTGIVTVFSYKGCEQEASLVHLKTDWGFFEGCVVTLKDGQVLTQDQFDNYYRVNQKQ